MLLQDIQREKNDAKGYNVKQKLLRSVSEFVRGPAQVYFKSQFGVLGGALSALGFIGVSAVSNRIGFSTQRVNLLNAYRDELALVLGKDRDAINEADMISYVTRAEAAQSPIAQDYEILKKNERAVQTKSLIKNIVISASVFTFAAICTLYAAPTVAAGEMLATAIGAGSAGLALSMIGYSVLGAITTAIDVVAENVLEKWQSVQHQTGMEFVRQIQKEIAREPVKPAQLFEYTVQVKPQITAVISANLHEEYATMSHERKLMVIERLGLTEPLKQITNDLNHGKIRPSELPFLLAGKDSPSTPVAKYITPSVAKVAEADIAVAPQLEVAAPVAALPEKLVHGAQLQERVQAPALNAQAALA